MSTRSKALEVEARPPEKFLNVCDDKVTDVDGLEKTYLDRDLQFLCFSHFMQTPMPHRTMSI